MTNLQQLTADDLVCLIDFYNRFDKWALIVKIIRIENIDNLRDILQDYK